MVTRVNNRMIDGAIISVLDFNAIGDGTTNDTVAVQNAINQTGTIDLAQRTYSVDTLTMPANTKIINGTLQLRTPNTKLVIMDTNTTLDRVTLLGSGNTEENLAERLVSIGAENIGEVSPTITNVKITNCRLSASNGFGIRASYTTILNITNNFISNMRYCGFVGVGVTNVQVDRNHIDNITGLASNNNGYGVSFTTDSTIATGSGGILSTLCTASSNIITNIPTWNALDTHGGRNIVFSDNSIKNCKFAIGIVSSPKPSSIAVSPRYVTCSGNSIENTGISTTGASFGITVSGEDTFPCQNITVTGNTLMECGEPGNGISGAIQIKDTRNCTIAGNSIHRPRPHGITIYSRNYGFNVTGNTVVDPFDDTVTTPTGIVVRAPENEGFVGSNTLYATGANVGIYTAIRGIDVVTGTDVDVNFGNNISNYDTQFRGYGQIDPDLSIVELIDATGGSISGTVNAIGDTTTVDQSPAINNNNAKLLDRINQLIRIMQRNGVVV